MAGENRNLAYDLSSFENADEISMSSAGKKSKINKKRGQIISISQGSSAKAQRRKRNPFVIFSVTLLTVVLAGVAIMMVHFSAQINELNNQITERKAVLTELQNEEAQYQLQIDSKMTDSFVKNYAETKLKMTPMKNAQKQFVSLSDGDNGKVFEDESSRNVFTTILDAFTSVFM